MGDVRSVSILGVTGSVGRATADVVKAHRATMRVHAVTAYRDVAGLARMAMELEASVAVIGDDSLYQALKHALAGTDIRAAAGAQAIEEAASSPVDVTMAAIVGVAGLRPVMAAIRRGGVIAIANKEPLVAAGTLIMRAARRSGATILPVDSEHNAIFQVFDRDRRGTIEKIILTASGGPFRTWSHAQMESATPAQAVAHPNWSMGAKISVDSATMMNKALEVIEAHYLFDMPADKIDVVIHPQSVIHSMVSYCDGSVLAQMGAPDMRTPIAYCLGWPGRCKTPGSFLDVLSAMPALTFEPPDHTRFPALALAYDCLESGAASCLALNAANEVAVAAFLDGQIGFTEIYSAVSSCLEKIDRLPLDSIDDVVLSDEAVRRDILRYIHKDRSAKAAAGHS